MPGTHPGPLQGLAEAGRAAEPQAAGGVGLDQAFQPGAVEPSVARVHQHMQAHAGGLGIRAQPGQRGRVFLGGRVDQIDLQALHARRLTLFGVSNKQRSAEQRAAGVPAFVADILPAIADGRIRPVVDRVFPFAELPAAQACMETNQHLGKIVLKINA